MRSVGSNCSLGSACCSCGNVAKENDNSSQGTQIGIITITLCGVKDITQKRTSFGASVFCYIILKKDLTTTTSCSIIKLLQNVVDNIIKI